MSGYIPPALRKQTEMARGIFSDTNAVPIQKTSEQLQMEKQDAMTVLMK